MIVYNPINWKNRAVEHKHRYEMSQAESAGLVYLTPAPGEVDEPGTPINADNLNHMDEAILAHDQKLDELEQKKVNISGGDISDTVATLDETVGDAADNIASGESLRTILSKIHKVIRQFFNHKTDTVIHTTKADKDKLAGIEEHANNYVHPDTHPAGMITSDANHRFVTDDKIEAWDNSLETSKTYTNGMYQQATGYTDKKIADLINGAPETLDTIGEVAQAIKENESVVKALNAAIGKKANQTEIDTHVNNEKIHVDANKKAQWDGYEQKIADINNNYLTRVWINAEGNYVSSQDINIDAWTANCITWLNAYTDKPLGTLPTNNIHALFINNRGLEQVWIDATTIYFRNRDSTSLAWGQWYDLGKQLISKGSIIYTVQSSFKMGSGANILSYNKNVATLTITVLNYGDAVTSWTHVATLSVNPTQIIYINALADNGINIMIDESGKVFARKRGTISELAETVSFLIT